MIKKLFIFLILLGSPIFFAIETNSFDTIYVRDDVWIISSDIYALPVGTERLELYIPQLNTIAAEAGVLGYRTNVTFFNANGFPIVIIPLQHEPDVLLPDLLEFMEFYGRVILELDNLALADYPQLVNVVGFGIEIVFNVNFTFEYANNILHPFFLDNFFYALDEEEIELPNYGSIPIIFYDRGSVYFRYSYSGIPLEPPEPYRFGYDFLGWFEHVDLGGEQYLFDEVLDEYFFGVQSQLYARWQVTKDLEIIETNLSVPDALLNALGLAGLNSVGGRTLIYFIIMLFMTISLLLLKLPAVAIISSNFILTTVFMFIGWFPIYMIIIIGGSLLVGLITVLKGGI